MGIHLPTSFSMQDKFEGSLFGHENRVYFGRSDIISEKDYRVMIWEKAAEKIFEMEEIKKEIALAKKEAGYAGEDMLTRAADEAIRVCREVLARCSNLDKNSNKKGLLSKSFFTDACSLTRMKIVCSSRFHG